MRLVTYNIHKGIGGRDRRCRLERILRVLTAQDADIVCLQEVTRHARRTHRQDQPALIRHAVGLAAMHYQMNVHYLEGGYGNLLLSRWPLLEQHRISLRYRKRKQRGAQLASIDTPTGPLVIVNWHLGLSMRERRWQAEHLVRHRLFRQMDDLPTLLAGDTNDWQRQLPRYLSDECGFDLATRPPSRFRTFPAWMPVGTLDQVYVRGGISIRHAAVVRSKLSHIASDHLPVIVDFALPRR